MAFSAVFRKERDAQVGAPQGATIVPEVVQVAGDAAVQTAYLQMRLRNLDADGAHRADVACAVSYGDGSHVELSAVEGGVDLAAGGTVDIEPIRLPRADVTDVKVTVIDSETLQTVAFFDDGESDDARAAAVVPTEDAHEHEASSSEMPPVPAAPVSPVVPAPEVPQSDVAAVAPESPVDSTAAAAPVTAAPAAAEEQPAVNVPPMPAAPAPGTPAPATPVPGGPAAPGAVPGAPAVPAPAASEPAKGDGKKAVSRKTLIAVGGVVAVIVAIAMFVFGSGAGTPAIVDHWDCIALMNDGDIVPAPASSDEYLDVKRDGTFRLTLGDSIYDGTWEKTDKYPDLEGDAYELDLGTSRAVAMIEVTDDGDEMLILLLTHDTDTGMAYERS